jgi:hypothetical protein
MPATQFKPEVHGFAFVNAWKLEALDRAGIRERVERITYAVTNILRFLFGGKWALVAFKDCRDKLRMWVDGILDGTYGYCGGMAFAAVDYYHRPDLDFPRGTERDIRPTWDRGADLRKYIVRRLVDSLIDNAPIFLTWMAFLHVIPEKSLLRGGKGWLRRKSEQEWRRLKRHLDAGDPWPIGLVGETKNPTFNHQIVAYDYEYADGAITIYVYDVNCPGQANTIRLEFGEERLGVESCHDQGRGALQGFFCERYRRKSPPAVVWP